MQQLYVMLALYILDHALDAVVHVVCRFKLHTM